MKKYAVLNAIFFALLSIVITSPQTLASDKIEAPTITQQEHLNKAEQSLNKIKTFEADIIQTSSHDKERLTGKIKLSRPNKMLLTYDSPDMPRIIADGTILIYVEDSLGQVTHLGLDSTPAFFILQDKISFSDERLIVQDVTVHSPNLYITVMLKDSQMSGSITLVFRLEDYTLLGWTVTDAKRIKTNISLINTVVNGFIDDKLFEFVNPYTDERKRKKYPFLRN